MKDIKEYITINEGLKDSFINIIKNIFNHKENSQNEYITIEVDPKVFGSFCRDEEYFSDKNQDYPKLIPIKIIGVDDKWTLHVYEQGKDKYGNIQSIYTFIGIADFIKDNHKFEIEENYKDLVEKILEKYEN